MRASVRHRMQAAVSQPASRQAHVQRFGRQLAIQFGLLQGVTAGFQRRLHRLLGFVDAGAGGLARVGRHRTQAFQQFGELAAFAQVTRLNLFQRRQIGAGLNRGKAAARFRLDCA
jgi:hypothetical protein